MSKTRETSVVRLRYVCDLPFRLCELENCSCVTPSEPLLRIPGERRPRCFECVKPVQEWQRLRLQQRTMSEGMGRSQGEIRVYRNEVWISISKLVRSGRKAQLWKKYNYKDLEVSHEASWWLGLEEAQPPVEEIPDIDLPQPILKAYAFTIWGPPPSEGGWARHGGTYVCVPWPNPAFEIWYSPLVWSEIFESTEDAWTQQTRGAFARELTCS